MRRSPRQRSSGARCESRERVGDLGRRSPGVAGDERDTRLERQVAIKCVPDELSGEEERLARLCKRAYKLLNLSGYARMDLRLTPEGEIYLLPSLP